MQIEVKNNNFIRLDNLIKVQNLNTKINDYNFVDNRLSGVYKIDGEYLNKDFDNTQSFSYDIPFDIIFTDQIQNIENVELSDFEYFEIEGRGLEFEATLSIMYNTYSPYQEIKEEVDQKLKEHLEIYDYEEEVERNLVENTFLPTNESKTKIRIQF